MLMKANNYTLIFRVLFALTTLFSLSLASHAQDVTPSPYDTALELIEQAEQNNSTTLDLESLGLEQVPPEIARLTQLETLDLEDNRLTEFPIVVTQLVNLTRLDLDSNQITSIPPEITQLTQLETLRLEHNQLTEFPIVITQLENLSQLDLDDNQITSIPPEIASMRSLNHLGLSGNNISSLPSELAELVQLQPDFSIQAYDTPLERYFHGDNTLSHDETVLFLKNPFLLHTGRYLSILVFLLVLIGIRLRDLSWNVTLMCAAICGVCGNFFFFSAFEAYLNSLGISAMVFLPLVYLLDYLQTLMPDYIVGMLCGAFPGLIIGAIFGKLHAINQP